MLNNFKKQSLPVINDQEQTCYELINMSNCTCKNKTCKQWIPYKDGKNCVFVTTKKGPLTLREIGDIYGLTRMRICQIEKKIYKKIRDYITESM